MGSLKRTFLCKRAKLLLRKISHRGFSQTKFDNLAHAESFRAANLVHIKFCPRRNSVLNTEANPVLNESFGVATNFIVLSVLFLEFRAALPNLRLGFRAADGAI